MLANTLVGKPIGWSQTAEPPETILQALSLVSYGLQPMYKDEERILTGRESPAVSRSEQEAID
jgi:hypothetical protein